MESKTNLNKTSHGREFKNKRPPKKQDVLLQMQVEIAAQWHAYFALLSEAVPAVVGPPHAHAPLFVTLIKRNPGSSWLSPPVSGMETVGFLGKDSRISS